MPLGGGGRIGVSIGVSPGVREILHPNVIERVGEDIIFGMVLLEFQFDYFNVGDGAVDFRLIDMAAIAPTVARTARMLTAIMSSTRVKPTLLRSVDRQRLTTGVGFAG